MTVTRVFDEALTKLVPHWDPERVPGVRADVDSAIAAVQWVSRFDHNLPVKATVFTGKKRGFVVEVDRTGK